MGEFRSRVGALLLNSLFSDSSPRDSDVLTFGVDSGLCFLTSLPEDADPRGPTFALDLSMRDVIFVMFRHFLPSGPITTSQAAPRVG